MATPGHTIEIVPASAHVTISLGSTVVAETDRPVLLHESRLPTRYYLPFEDVRAGVLVPSETTSHCPFKGEASYWNVVLGDRTWTDLAWTYTNPIAQAREIAGLVCFYNEKVDIEVDGEILPRPTTGSS